MITQREKRLEASRDDWKNKNRERYEDIKALKMRLKETTESRERWKAISNEKEKILEELEKQNAEKDRFLTSLTQELEALKKKKR